MTTILSHVLFLLATLSAAFAHLRIPEGYNCVWEDNTCTQGRIFLALCYCSCPETFLCCDLSILNDYEKPIWRGTAPFCNARCSSCGSDDLCWWQSKCGNGSTCWTGNKVLCGVPKRKIRWPLLDKAVSLYIL